MTVSNHVLVGSAIALAVHQPILALPLAFGSHFVLDALPHFGWSGQGYGELFRHRLFYVGEGLDFIGLVVLVLTINFAVWTTLAAVILAVSPDFEWPYRYFLFERRGLRPPSTFLTKFHQKIQWGERPWGIVVEVVFFIIGYALVRRYLL